MDTILQRPNRLGGRNLGLLTSAGLNRPGSYPLGFKAKPTLTQEPDLGSSWGQPNGKGGMDLGTLTSADLSRGPVYATPTQPARPSASLLTRPPYNPPQQTERANPLSGANNYPMEGTSVATPRPPFVQRGTLPMGQDAVPAPIKETESEDSDIARSMRGTFGRLRDVMGRRFSQPSASPALTLARAQIG